MILFDCSFSRCIRRERSDSGSTDDERSKEDDARWIL
jgi:hypothetical protein